MAGEQQDQQLRRRAEVMQALTTQHFALQSARSLSGSEIALRSTLYLTTLSSAVVALALVSRFGNAFLIFSLAILPVVFFLGLVSYGRMLQNAVEYIVYGRSISRITRFYAGIDPATAEYFQGAPADETLLQSVGLFKFRWQQFLSATAMVAIVNAVVGGTFVSILIANIFQPSLWASTTTGGAATLVIAAAFLRHQRRVWARTEAALPIAGRNAK
jgi:hypothetical protein